MKFLNFKKNFLNLLSVGIALALGLSSCVEFEKSHVPEFYGRSNTIVANEFRWSIGELPRTIDPAKASSPAEMQVVRSTTEGLTEWDAKTLTAVPAVALKWEASEDFRTWIFYLRPNAVWTNGKNVTAQDFVRSWERLAQLDVQSPHKELIANVVGVDTIFDFKLQASDSTLQSANPKLKAASSKLQAGDSDANSNRALGLSQNNLLKSPETTHENQKTKVENQIKDLKSKFSSNESKFGVEAVDDLTLRVALINGDKDFPKLIAHSAFRPIYGDGSEFEKAENWIKRASNGAFQLVANNKNELTLERNPNYWNVSSVKLERVHLIAAKDAETALAAYQNGTLDAVTNVHLEPLALKLFDSYRDFERTTFNAVTFYEFNRDRAPFVDRRIREALAIAIDRERLSRDEMEGAAVPANNFLPSSGSINLKFDPERARKLLAEAGFAGGEDFPAIKLLINRNDQQRRIAKAVAAQWLKNLKVETEIIVSSLEEIDDPHVIADFDLVRRVVVLPTIDEFINLQIMFKRDKLRSAALNENKAERETDMSQSATAVNSAVPKTSLDKNLASENRKTQNTFATTENLKGSARASAQPGATHFETLNEAQMGTYLGEPDSQMHSISLTFTEAEMLTELPAIPLYFSSSYALVKPYVRGFDLNLLDAPSLKSVYLENDWPASQ